MTLSGVITNRMAKIDQQFSGAGPNSLTSSVAYILDRAVGLSGVYRPATQQDFIGASTNPTVSNFTPSGNSFGTVFLATSNRKRFYISNEGSGSNLFVKLGANAYSNSYNFSLKKASATNAGDGGNISVNDWSGVVSISGDNAFVHNWIAWQITGP